MNENKVKFGELVYYCLHTQFPKLKDTMSVKNLKITFQMDMGVVISEEDELGYLELYSQSQERTKTVHKEFIKVLTNV